MSKKNSNFASQMQKWKEKIMKLGDWVLISPDLTQLKDWVKAKVIDIENNSFVGVVISAETEDGNVFFGRNDLFKLAA